MMTIRMSILGCWAIWTQVRDEVWMTVEILTTNLIGIVMRREDREVMGKEKAKPLCEILQDEWYHLQIGRPLLRRRGEHLATVLTEHFDFGSTGSEFESFWLLLFHRRSSWDDTTKSNFDYFTTSYMQYTTREPLQHGIYPRRLGFLLLVPPNFSLVASETFTIFPLNAAPSSPSNALVTASLPAPNPRKNTSSCSMSLMCPLVFNIPIT